MEGGLPIFNCLLQHTLKSLCSSSDSSEPSKWVYAVLWRVLPRNFPTPKWDYGGGALDLIKGNKRNWILVWEDGYCDFDECERAAESGYIKGRFGGDVFFKMSHEVYNYGEGLLGKVAADNHHRWVFRGSAKDDPSCFSSWKVSIDPQPRAWEIQFKTGIQTIALIPVREGMIQLGSLDKVTEDPKLVDNIQKKISYLLSIPGISAIPRPSSITFNIKPTNPYTIEANGASLLTGDKHQLAGSKRLYSKALIETPIKSINLGCNMPQNGLTTQSMWSLPPLFSSWSCNYGPFLSSLSYGTSPSYPITSSELGLAESNIHSFMQKASPRDSDTGAETAPIVKVGKECAEENKSCCLNPNHGLDKNKATKRSRFCSFKEGDIVH